MTNKKNYWAYLSCPRETRTRLIKIPMQAQAPWPPCPVCKLGCVAKAAVAAETELCAELSAHFIPTTASVSE